LPWSEFFLSFDLRPGILVVAETGRGWGSKEIGEQSEGRRGKEQGEGEEEEVRARAHGEGRERERAVECRRTAAKPDPSSVYEIEAFFLTGQRRSSRLTAKNVAAASEREN